MSSLTRNLALPVLAGLSVSFVFLAVSWGADRFVVGYSDVTVAAGAGIASLIAAGAVFMARRPSARLRDALAEGVGRIAAVAETPGKAGAMARSVADLITATMDDLKNTIEHRLGQIAFHDAGQAMVFVDDEGVIRASNLAAVDTIGARADLFNPDVFGEDSAKSIIGIPIAKLSPQIAEYCRTDAGETETSRDIWVGESCLAVTGTKMASEGGCLIGWADVTETRRASRIAALIGEHSLMVEFDTSGNVIRAYPGFCAIAQTDENTLKGRSFFDLFKSADGSDPDWSVVAGGKPENEVWQMREGSDGPVFVQATFVPITADGVMCRVMMIGLDVTAHEAALRDAQLTDRQRTEAQKDMCSRLTSALSALADGKAQPALELPFDDAFEDLRRVFNAARESLNWAISSMQLAMGDIQTGCQTLSSETGTLTERAGSQAETIQRTSSALGKLIDSVERSVAGSDSAKAFVGRVRRSAEESGNVVHDAIDAMGAIESSSNQISPIIGVIEDIAFQTNLLALNAGVEAARAGESGRGFAVVATEVRALAQRSSDAANEIKTLISESEGHVANGVDLVNRAGAALTQITGEVAAIDEQVSAIAETSAVQTAGLKEIDGEVRRLDEVAQQNSQTVEAAKVAAITTAQSASKLADLVALLGVKAPDAPKVNPYLQNREKSPGTTATPTHSTAQRATTTPHQAVVWKRVPNSAVTVASGHNEPAVPTTEFDGGWEDF